MAAAKGRMPPPSLANGDGDLDDLESDFEALLRDSPRQRRSKTAAAEREKELYIIRSGSAPPSVEGARNAVSSIFGDLHAVDMNGYSSGATVSEEAMRSHPAYLSYYYSNGKMNPRVPPPSLSKEDWRMAQRLQVGTSAYGKISERRQQAGGSGVSDGNSCSLFALQPDIQMGGARGGLTEPMMVSENSSARIPSGEWVETGGGSFIGLPGNGMGMRTRSFADVLQVCSYRLSFPLRGCLITCTYAHTCPLKGFNYLCKIFMMLWLHIQHHIQLFIIIVGCLFYSLRCFWRGLG